MRPWASANIVLVRARAAAALAARAHHATGGAAKNPVVDTVSGVVLGWHEFLLSIAVGMVREPSAADASGDLLEPEMPGNGLPRPTDRGDTGAGGANLKLVRVGTIHAASSRLRRRNRVAGGTGPPETSTRLAGGFGVGIAYALRAIHPRSWVPRSGRGPDSTLSVYHNRSGLAGLMGDPATRACGGLTMIKVGEFATTVRRQRCHALITLVPPPGIEPGHMV